MSLLQWPARAAGRLADFIWPQACLTCDAPLPSRRLSGQTWCVSCRGELLRTCGLAACPWCGAELAGPGAGCTECRDRGIPNLDAVVRGWPYSRSARLGVISGKFNAHWPALHQMAHALAPTLQEAARAIPAGRSPVLVPIPIHWRRRLTRGFDQAEVISRALSQATDIPLQPLLRRNRFTSAQTQTDSRAQRLKNLSGAFSAREPASPDPAYLLVDDVLTTGATSRSAARTLRDAGAKWVGLVVLCVTDHQEGVTRAP